MRVITTTTPCLKERPSEKVAGVRWMGRQESSLRTGYIPPPRASTGNARSYGREYDGTACWNWLGRWMAWYTVIRPITRRIRGSIGLSHPAATQLGEKPHAESMFGSRIEMGIPSFFDVVGCADDRHIDFRVSAYLGGVLREWWGGESADKDDDHLERESVIEGVVGILGMFVDGHYPALVAFL
ncbi:hypothetical protein ARMGADRAFT_1040513 [Armillaria gallica]|uniref:Uncharacterized protein n=1 Tax=Armillaria gallica TaxID=47427 RepID=A0A2H3CDD2_ARMGA|nr:hypothetical protein ARMGADRAFT_1040513 [Armillaria gallica]